MYRSSQKTRLTLWRVCVWGYVSHPHSDTYVLSHHYCKWDHFLSLIISRATFQIISYRTLFPWLSRVLLLCLAHLKVFNYRHTKTTVCNKIILYTERTWKDKRTMSSTLLKKTIYYCTINFPLIDFDVAILTDYSYFTLFHTHLSKQEHYNKLCNVQPLL